MEHALTALSYLILLVPGQRAEWVKRGRMTKAPCIPNLDAIWRSEVSFTFWSPLEDNSGK